MPPVELVVDLLLRLALPSAAASAVVIGLTTRFANHRWWNFGLAAAIASGLIAGNWPRRPLPYVPDDCGWPWLLPAVMIALFVGAFAQTIIPKIAMRFVLAFVAVGTLTFCLIPIELRTAPWLLGFLIVTIGNSVALDLQSQRTKGCVTLFAWAAVLLGGAAAVLICAHSARLADAALLLASALAGAALVTSRAGLDVRTCALAEAIYVPGLMISGYHGTFSEVPWISFALLGAAPWALFLSLLPAARRLPSRTQVAVQIGLLAAPVAVAIALAIRAEGFAIGY